MQKLKIDIGEKYGRLTVLRNAEKRGTKLMRIKI